MKRLISSVLLIIFTANLSHAQNETAEQILLQDQWYKCLQVYALTVAERTTEPSSLIADAAMTACQKQEDKLYHFYGRNRPEPFKSMMQIELLGAQRDDYKKKILVEILAVRAS